MAGGGWRVVGVWVVGGTYHQAARHGLAIASEAQVTGLSVHLSGLDGVGQFNGVVLHPSHCGRQRSYAFGSVRWRPDPRGGRGGGDMGE